MSDDYYYYKERCAELENKLSTAQNTIDRLNLRLYDIRMACERSHLQNGTGMLDTILWLTYDWKD